MFKITFIVFLMAMDRPVTATIPEKTEFQTLEACGEFGDRMKPRVADWVRGRINSDWDVQIKVDFKCNPVGQGT